MRTLKILLIITFLFGLYELDKWYDKYNTAAIQGEIIGRELGREQAFIVDQQSIEIIKTYNRIFRRTFTDDP